MKARTLLCALAIIVCGAVYAPRTLVAQQPAKTESAKRPKRNRLAESTSPYLRLHADNPVDWRPWGKEALAEAKRLDRPILLSIGYSACHWCHVMNRESFADPALAERLNANFICIKVDREERPDVDSLYMEAVRAMTGQGGWPLTAFLMPDGRPFAGGTYFPPTDRKDESGKVVMPSFGSVVTQALAVFRHRRPEVEKFATEVANHLKTANRAPRAVNAAVNRTTIDEALAEISKRFDGMHGGMASPPRFAPKFPQPAVGVFVVETAKSSNDPAIAAIVLQVEKMALGGIHDQIAGGWHRYSTDREWIVPHFEKMLYDQATMLLLLAKLQERSPSPLWKHAALLTAEFLEREMRAPDGLFFAALDADSEHEEGKFYVWSTSELDSILDKDANEFRKLTRVGAEPNFEGRHILQFSKDYFDKPQSDADPRRAMWERGRRKLLEARGRRVRPRADHKTIASWNGLLIYGLAESGGRFNDDRMKAMAKQAADSIQRSLVFPDGSLARHAIDGKKEGHGYADDYAAVILGLLAVDRLGGNSAWKEAAIRLGRSLRGDFWDVQERRLKVAGKRHEALLANLPDNYDGALPSATSLAALAFVELARVTKDAEFRNHAADIVASEAATLSQSPLAATSLLLAWHRMQAQTAESPK